MGDSQSKLAEQKRAKFEKMFRKNFSKVQDKIDDIFGQVQLYQNVNTKKTEVLIKSINYFEQQQIKKIIQNFERRITNPIFNLLSVYQLQVIDQNKGICGSGMFLKIYVQYLERSLKDELKRRRKHRAYNFSQQQLWKIMISLINAIRHLHQQKIFHGEISLSTILIDGDYFLKLVQKTLLNPTNWQLQFNKEDVKLIKGKGILFSPVILKCLFNQRTQLAMYDPFKGDIFAIGMVMLQCCSLKKAQDFYDYQKFNVKMKDIQHTIYDLRKKYSYQLMNLIQKMLQQQDSQRLTALQIYQKIRLIPNQTIKELNMTFNQQSHLNESIRSYM